jgi:hypothetical protein
MMPILGGYGLRKTQNFWYIISVIFLTARIELKDQKKGDALRLKHI